MAYKPAIIYARKRMADNCDRNGSENAQIKNAWENMGSHSFFRRNIHLNCYSLPFDF